LNDVDRAQAMAKSVETAARAHGMPAPDVELVRHAYALAMTARGALDEHDPAYLHPGRSVLVLLQDVGPLPACILAVAAVHESEDSRFRASVAGVRAALGDDVADIIASLPLPGDERLTERLLALEDRPRLAALAERLDHLRHAHLREDRAWWRMLQEETEAVWAPIAERTHPRLADRYRAWLRAMGRRLRTA
jgi:hypothetical protein